LIIISAKKELYKNDGVGKLLDSLKKQGFITPMEKHYGLKLRLTAMKKTASVVRKNG